MGVCVNCGKEADGCLCDSCRSKVDIEELCDRIIEYKFGSNENLLWEQQALEYNSKNAFKKVVFALAEELTTPRKEYWKTLSFTGYYANIQKDKRPWLYETYESVKEKDGLSRFEMNRIKGIVLGALFKDYRYEDADLLADELLEEDSLPSQAYENLADFYIITRHYDEAETVLQDQLRLYGNETVVKNSCEKLLAENEDRRIGNKAEYLPKAKAEKQKYIEYMSSIGVDVLLPAATPKSIPKDQYPAPKETRDTSFDAFVAYDLETTGLSPNTDAIIEIGAIKVISGKVIESKGFTFTEFVRPFKKSVREEVTKQTGITKDDVKEARQMWDVFSDFMRFSDGYVMVGYNNIMFDSRFLARAGRYANIIMENLQFDVMKYAMRIKEKVGITDSKVSLQELSQKLGVNSPVAHRALPDAITTAQVFLKLKEMDTEDKAVHVDDLLSDLENW